MTRLTSKLKMGIYDKQKLSRKPLNSALFYNLTTDLTYRYTKPQFFQFKPFSDAHKFGANLERATTPLTIRRRPILPEQRSFNASLFRHQKHLYAASRQGPQRGWDAGATKYGSIYHVPR